MVLSPCHPPLAGNPPGSAPTLTPGRQGARLRLPVPDPAELTVALFLPRVADNPKLGLLREGLKLFIGHFLLKGARAPRSAEETDVLRERAELTTRALQGRAALRM